VRKFDSAQSGEGASGHQLLAPDRQLAQANANTGRATASTFRIEAWIKR
jgi:hypothetical protein